MISFRYHLVSIIAVFLALALGIAVGTTGLNGAILSDLRANVKSQKAQIDKLNGENSSLQKQANNADDFASSYAKQVLTGTLTGQSVLLLSAPGADSKIKSGVETVVDDSGATLSGKIQFSNSYVDPASGADITNLVTNTAVRPAGLQVPVTTDSATLGAALLAYVLGGQGSSGDISKVLAAFTTLNMLKVEGADPKAAKIVILIGSGSAAAGDSKTKSMPVLVNELNKAGIKVVVAGNNASATAAGLIALVRSDSILPRAVSTVDNADSGLGQVSTVLAAAALVKGTAGQYGTGSGASAVFPSAPK